VIARLGLAGDETVADIGCGTGRDAEQLLGLLPRGRVIAVDGSAPAERRPFVRAVARRLAEPVIDYVRLQIRAVRP
jgi:trans-aconitate 2-methyltransferase